MPHHRNLTQQMEQFKLFSLSSQILTASPTTGALFSDYSISSLSKMVLLRFRFDPFRANGPIIINKQFAVTKLLNLMKCNQRSPFLIKIFFQKTLKHSFGTISHNSFVIQKILASKGINRVLEVLKKVGCYR